MSRIFARRVYAIALGCLAALVAVGAQAAAIPFVTASVHSPDGRVFTIDWKAPGVRRVMIYAGREPDHVGRGRLVARGAGAGAAVVSGLPAASRWYFRLTPDRGQALVIADRSLHLTTAGNFRDIGGYRTADGHWVRMGLAYRSNALDGLTPDELTAVGGLRLRLVTDLRTDAERRRGPDRTPPGVRDLPADVLADNAKTARSPTSLAQPMSAQEHRARLAAVYRDFVDLASARAAYHATFERLASPGDVPNVFHCSAGKDRTGWADAVLLTILGVPRETIIQDYQLTNLYLKGPALEQLRKTFGPTAGAAPGRSLADVEDLQAAFDEVDRHWGGFDNYLHKGLGLDQATLDSIRRTFLVG